MISGWIEVRRFPDQADLSKLHDFLTQHNVEHMFTEEMSEQVLWLSEQSNQNVVIEFIERYLRGEIELKKQSTPDKSTSVSLLAHIRLSPATTILLILGFLGYLAIDIFNSVTVYRIFVFLPVEHVITEFEPWRLFTPALMHFSLLHFVFNALWLLLLGRHLERYLGVFQFVVLLMITALSANIMQFYLSGSNSFGGLSGVVYGLVGAFVAGHWLFKEKALFIQGGLLVFSLLAMCLSFTGMFDWLAGASIANWAHLGGFIGGMSYLIVYLSIKNRKLVS